MNFATEVVVVDGVSAGADVDLEGSPGLAGDRSVFGPARWAALLQDQRHMSFRQSPAFIQCCLSTQSSAELRKATQSCAVILIDAVALQPTTP